MSTKPANQKRRNNEKRKEKSRVAARCRRTKEMQIFSELTAALPAKKEEVEQLDKASVMRLAISYLRVRDVVTLLPESSTSQPDLQVPKSLEDVTSELSYMKALDGFVLVVSQQGDIVYCSENISDHLGVSQMEIMGQSISEFSHPCDHEDVREALRAGTGGRRELLLRLKCTLTGKGRNVHLKSASYKVIHVTGHMLLPREEKKNRDNSQDGDEEKPAQTPALVAVGRPIPHPSNIEIPLDSKTFLSKHSLDMKFTYTDDSLENTLGFSPQELVGKSLYDYHHAGDSAALAQHYKSLFSKGQCETGQYRFLAKSGGYAWVQTQATVITDKQQKPVSVVCVNYVVSGIESKDEVFAAHQLLQAELKPAAAPPTSAAAIPAPRIAPAYDVPNGAIVAILPPEEERPIPVTELIFAPRKKEMNKGFLMPSQDEGLTMFKDEPEDLTHLAPTPGDACIPLENSPFDMFDEFILSDNYCTLLGDELANGSPVDSLTTSDTLLLSSPEHQETDSSCDQSSLLTELSLDAFDCGRSENDPDDGKSPFLPLSDELPLLEPAVMWGALPEGVSQAKPQPSDRPASAGSAAPALQRLLAAPPAAAPATGPLPQDLITNIYSDQGLMPSKSVSSWDTGVKRLLKQEDLRDAKRTKRSPSPAGKLENKMQSSSVLMNLLDIPSSTAVPRVAPALPNYQLVMQAQARGLHAAAAHNIQLMKSLATKQVNGSPTPNPVIMRTPMANNSMSPLSLNVSPMYSLPSSPNSFSPNVSPSHRMLHSPYSGQSSMSPVARYMYSPGSKRNSPVMQNDPYLTNKMQQSPALAVHSPIDSLLDPTVSLPSPDYWNEEMLQTPGDLLNDMGELKMA